MPTSDSLVDHIYEAVVIPDLWREICIALATEVDVYSVAVSSLGVGATHRRVSAPQCAATVRSLFAQRRPLPECPASTGAEKVPGMFSRDTDIMSAEELATDPVYNAFLYPNGLKWSAGYVVQEPSGGEVGQVDMRVLSGLFDLTPAEAKLARYLASGASAEAAAEALGLSIQTIRTYLKRIMAKTGTRRQAKLAVLLSGLKGFSRLPVARCGAS